MIDSEKLRITTLVENSTACALAKAEWGLSIIIEAGETSYLFDTGASDLVIQNAETLNIDLSGIDGIVLSHGHWDHTGGLLSVLKRTCQKDIPVIAHPGVFNRKYYYNKDTKKYKYIGIPHRTELLEDAGARFKLSSGPIWLSDDIAVSGEVPLTTDFEKVSDEMFVKTENGFIQDPLEDDYSMYIRTDLGLVIILGCAHRGMINTIKNGQDLMKTDRIHMVIGGTHLGPAPEMQVDKTIETLKEMDTRKLGPSHCTGLPVAGKLAREFGDRFFFNTAGKKIWFDE
ncbi:MAG: MBL fold metallo-hydrolase [candidate division Zixibacteria bacterium]|nr:MBL fold metallo-hydrolase [candidate division Zixibacteria bacterium]